MSILTNRKTAEFGVPWEDSYGYVQAVEAGGVIRVAGQFSHDSAGNFIAPAEIGPDGRVLDARSMAKQMRQTYDNAASILAHFGATLADVVEETIYAVDFEAAFAVAGPVRKAAYGVAKPRCASTIVGTTRLALPVQLVEISLTAVKERL